MKIVELLGTIFSYFCVGTVLAIGALVLMLGLKGALTGERFQNMMAAVYGISIPAPAAATTTSTVATTEELPSFEQLLERRTLASLHLDLRESALDKSLADLRNIETQVRDERKRLDQWKESFDNRLSALQTNNTDVALQELQRTLESLQPKQAKEQILKMLDRTATKTDKPMGDVVTILKAMPLDKRKKILAEFKSAEDAEKLSEILEQVRLGVPDSELLRDSRQQLQQQLNRNR
jgi:hypothetical protein